MMFNELSWLLIFFLKNVEFITCFRASSAFVCIADEVWSMDEAIFVLLY